MTDEKRPDADEKNSTQEVGTDEDTTEESQHEAGATARPDKAEENVSSPNDSKSAEQESAEQQSAEQEPAEQERAEQEPVTETVSAEPASDEPVAADQDQVGNPSVPPKPKGRILAVLAFLVALLAVGGVGYLYYLLVYLQPLDDVRNENAQLAQEYAQIQSGIESRLQALSRETESLLETAAAQQAERLAENEDAVLKSLQEALSAAPPSQREWKLAEAEYLMRIANHRVLMEQDSEGALQLLQAADQIMAELDDFALHQVRARLADEIIALRQVRRDDLQGIYLRLEAVKSQLDNLPLPQPEYLQDVSDNKVDESVWATLLTELKDFVRVRSLDAQEALQPLLAPDEIRYLELNLRLALEQAQLATLKRQQGVYEQSLLNVRSWLVAHADVQDSRTKALLETVDELLLFELARPLPEISGSLTELLNVRRGGS
jgi:uroporphyrin-III C-methyltransferase